MRSPAKPNIHIKHNQSSHGCSTNSNKLVSDFLEPGHPTESEENLQCLQQVCYQCTIGIG